MKSKLLLIVVSSYLLLAGCSKNGASVGEMKISRIYAAGQLQAEFSYDASGLLKSHIVYGLPGRKTSEVTCYYDASARLIKKESAFDFSSGPTPQWSYSFTDYSYGADGRISEEKNYLKQNNVDILTSKIKPGFDAGGHLISRTMYLPNDALVRLTTYHYNNNGNIILQEEFRYNGTIAGLEYRYSYDNYDNQRNPYNGLMSSVPPFSVNVNNILQTTVTNYVITPGTPVINTTHSVYGSYNANGFPVKVIENGTSFTYEYN